MCLTSWSMILYEIPPCLYTTKKLYDISRKTCAWPTCRRLPARLRHLPRVPRHRAPPLHWAKVSFRWKCLRLCLPFNPTSDVSSFLIMDYSAVTQSPTNAFLGTETLQKSSRCFLMVLKREHPRVEDELLQIINTLEQFRKRRRGLLKINWSASSSFSQNSVSHTNEVGAVEKIVNRPHLVVP